MANLVKFNPLFTEVFSSAVGGVIAILILYGLYRLINKFGVEFIAAQQAQAAALAAQATSMAALTATMSEYVMRDNGEHSEMLILLKMLAGHSGALTTYKGDSDGL